MEKYEYEIMYDIESTYWWFRGKQFLLAMLLSDHLDDDRSYSHGSGYAFLMERTQRGLASQMTIDKKQLLNRHDIRFPFSPSSFKIGAAISVISLIGIIVFFFLIRRKRPLQKEGTT